MVNYNLEEFKRWLGTDLEATSNSRMQRGDGLFLNWQNFFQNTSRYLNVILQWAEEVNRENQAPLQTQITTLKEQLRTANQTSEEDAQQIQQRNQTIQGLASQLRELQTKHDQYLTQRKTQIEQELQLIREVLND